MRILLIHPNYHSGGAEIAGNWPPAWAAYLTGSLKGAGYTDIRFIDAMTNNLSDDQLRAILSAERPDIVGATAITPSIYKAERALQIAKEVHPGAVTILGGIHATFMYQQVLSEAPWIDVIVRGEGEEILIELVTLIDAGAWPAARHGVMGLAFSETDSDGTRIVATAAAATVKDLDAINPDWSILEWNKACMMGARAFAATSSWPGMGLGKANTVTSPTRCLTSSKSCEPPFTHRSSRSRTPGTSGWATRSAFRPITLSSSIAGGEFVMTEQRPRMQTRAAVVQLNRGDAVIFAVNSGPVRGGRGDYQVKLRHGVSKLRAGRRHTLGIIFHDAA